MIRNFSELVEKGRSLGFGLAEGDERAQATVNSMARVSIALVVSLTIGALVAAFLLPIGIEEIVGVDTTNWSSGAQSIWGILDVIIVLAVMLFFFGVALEATKQV